MQAKKGDSIGNYLTKEEIDHQKARYDGCINYVDDQLRSFFDYLKSARLFEDTLIVVTSDHGEEFLDHGRLLHTNPYWEHMIHIPLIIKFPGSAYAGQRIQHLATTIDLMPTILESVGIPVSDQAQGISLLPAVAEGKKVRRAINIFGGMRTERWKYIPGAAGGKLFDLTADPQETKNLSLAERDMAERLKSAGREEKRLDEESYADFVATTQSTQEMPGLTREEIDELRALGYLQ